MDRRLIWFVLAVVVSVSTGCAVLGNVYSMQNHIDCPSMAEDELHAELRRDADAIAQRVGQKAYLQVDRPDAFILNIRLPNKKPATFWYGRQPVDIRMSTESGGLFIAVYKANDPQPDETTREAQDAVEKTIAASKCRLGDRYLSQFDMI